jgi:hypothetical protein
MAMAFAKRNTGIIANRIGRRVAHVKDHRCQNNVTGYRDARM